MLFVIAVLFPGQFAAGEAPAPEDRKERTNYSIGYQVGGDMRRQGIAIEPRTLLEGVQDAVSGGQPRITREEMRATLADIQKRVVKYQEGMTKQEAERNLAEGMAFLAENSGREGVVTLPSGLQYRIMRKGAGRRPKAEDTVTVRYRGTLVDGAEFDSSNKSGKPATFRADRVIPGWKEALLMMNQGDKWQLFVPPALGYGERRNGRIGPNSTLIFDIELIGVTSHANK